MTIYLDFILLFVNKHGNIVHFSKAGLFIYFSVLFRQVLYMHFGPEQATFHIFSRKHICLGPKSTGDILVAESLVDMKTLNL